MELVIVQLTDIHIRDDEDFDVLSERINSIGGAICNHIIEPDDTVVLFCLTGDFAFSGKEEQYIAFEILLEQIYSIVKRRFPKVESYFAFVPGNHDCNFDDEAAAIRETLLASPTLDIMNASVLRACTNIQKNYFDFVTRWDKKYGAMSCQPDKILTINELNLSHGNFNIKFHCLNTSWCSKRYEEKGKMKIVNGKMRMPSSQLPNKTSNDIIITMMHHDAEWLDWNDKDVWNEYHKKYSDIIIVGHDHTTEFVLKQNYDQSSNYFVKGNQLFDKNTPEQSGFNVLKIKNSDGVIQECFFTYEWKNGLYKKVIDTGYYPFKRNRFFETGIELKKEVQNFLEEMDIDITYGDRKEIKLSDIFGFPTLKEDKGKVTKFLRDMPSLINYLKENRYVSIQGQKEYGKTALLKQLFKQYFEMKKFPIFLDISKINTADGEALNRILEDKYNDTYNNIDANAIMQKDSEERVCLIDNFEEIRLTDKSAKKLFQYLMNKFGYIILTRNHTLDILSPLKYVELNDYIQEKFCILRIQPTQRTSKERIINKWLKLSGEYEENSVSFDVKRKEKYAQIQSVMKSNYFNKTPIDLLLVLSYLEQEHLTQLDYSRYSYVYDQLILKKLTLLAGNYGSRMMSNDISIYKTILQQVAYKMYMTGVQEYAKEEDVLGAIFDYKEHHSNTKLNASEVIKRLVDFKFLECKEDTYKFKHNYMYYYFVGSYIESVLSPTERNRVIKKVFNNINDNANYNIALFLAYKLNIKYEILPLVKEFGDPLLDEYQDFKYDNIRKLIEEWGGDIERKVDRIYNVPRNEEIPLLREKKMEELEEQEEKEINCENSKKDEEVQKTNSDVLKMGRYIDFMGNILKNYSGKMENETREEAIDFIFKSVSRVIGSLCNFSMYIVDKIIQMIEGKIKEGDEEEIKLKSEYVETIKTSLAEVLYTFIEANLMAVASSLESDILRENIASYCEMHSSEFVKMARLEYLIRISSTRLPVDEINRLFKGKECLSEISQGILKDNIYRYLSNFQYDVKDRQMVCSCLGFDSKNLLIQEQKIAALSKK